MTFLKTTQTKRKKGTIKTDRKRLIKRLDDLCREVLHKFESVCCCCGKTGELQVGHFVTRRVYILRWDIRNIHLQCAGCNLRHNYDPSPYASYMLRRYGKPIFNDLISERNRVQKLTNANLETMENIWKGLR